MVLYHGSVSVIEKPVYHGGKATNDYGYGFYCTENIDLAREWACADSFSFGYVNRYEFDISSMRVLDLTSKEYTILNWMAILLKYRSFDISNAIALQAKEYLLQHFYIDVSQYDVVIGYRADDSYFRFAKDFINNTISVEKLSRAMKLGDLGKQVVLISRKAHDEIRYVSSEPVDYQQYHAKRAARDRKARESYLKSKDDLSGLYVRDVIRMGLEHGDEIL